MEYGQDEEIYLMSLIINVVFFFFFGMVLQDNYVQNNIAIYLNVKDQGNE